MVQNDHYSTKGRILNQEKRQPLESCKIRASDIDRFTEDDLGGGGTAHYQYDSGMQRVRKVVKSGGTIKECVYLGGFEIYREYKNGNQDLRRETLHVMDDQNRIALVETLTHENSNELNNPQSIIRFQLNDHLGSSTIELDENAEVITYEEYYPYEGNGVKGNGVRSCIATFFIVEKCRPAWASMIAEQILGR